MNLYNENDPRAAAWLQELINAGEIPPGEVDTRDIQSIPPNELSPDIPTHFFAGIGGWPLALRLAGVPDEAPVWTGSCPCQPFSVAGKRKGARDKRHLWPWMRRAIAHARPAIVFGEQVASAAGRDWLAGIRLDLEKLGYAVGAADLCAASVGAPHIRQRLFWVAIAGTQPRRGMFDNAGNGTEAHQKWASNKFGRSGCNGGLAKSASVERQIGRVAAGIDSLTQRPNFAEPGETERLGALSWHNSEVIYCLDDKWRRVESGTLPLAHGVPGRVGLLRGYGNAIVPQLAALFIQASLEAIAV